MRTWGPGVLVQGFVFNKKNLLRPGPEVEKTKHEFF
jgi:hypothetical protein